MGMTFAEAFTAILTVMAILYLYLKLSSQKNRNPGDTVPQLSVDDIRLNVVRQTFCDEGRLVEEVMTLCFRHPHTRLFQDYRAMGPLEQREAFCELCLQASSTGNGGIIEVAMLSSEFVSMYRAAIGFATIHLSKEVTSLYRSAKPVSTVQARNDLFETHDLLDWAEAHLLEDKDERKQKIRCLVQAFAAGKIIFRFKRRTIVGPISFAPKKEVQEEGANK